MPETMNNIQLELLHIVQQFSAKRPVMMNEPAAHCSTGFGENGRAVLLLFCTIESITDRQKSCSQGNGAQVSIGVRSIQSGQDIGDKTERFLTALEVWAG